MEEKVLNIPVEDILPNRFQPRLAFDEKELMELSNSILRYGVVQPIVLRKIGDKYEIIAGERRYKASVLAGLKTVPAIIKETDDNTSAEIALLENLQRKDLSVIEEAQSYKKLLDRHFTQEEIASKLGISQSTIANRIRLLNLPKKVQNSLLYNKISERHARSLLTLNDEKKQIELLDKIISNRLTVRQTEDEISKLLNKATVDNDIPEQIIKIMNDKTNNTEVEEQDNQKQETPSVISIDDDTTKEVINPFQIQFENNVKKIEENIDKQPERFYDEIINNDLKKNNFNYIDNSIINEIKKQSVEETRKEEKDNSNVVSLISKVRSFVNNIKDENIEIKELDLADKYQIVINIKKED